MTDELLHIKIDSGTIHPIGDIDMQNAPMFLQAVLDAAEVDVPVHLDMSDVAFIDSAGIRALLQAHQERVLTIADLSPQVLRVIEMSGLREELRLV